MALVTMLMALVVHDGAGVWFKHILLTPKQVKNLYKWISIR